MHTMRLLEKWLQRNAVIGHQAREHALVRVVDALLSGGRLALTALGRHRAGSAFVKHHIKAVDRLLGNRHLHRERDGVYGALARTVLGGIARPVILVDWADSALAHKQLILKAAVPVKGRAISIYEEVHSMRCYNTARTHRRFLHRLQSVLPEGCRPIVVTDAGFRGPWFRDVEALGWDWVGRIRNRIKYLKPETGRWCFIHSLYRQATTRVRHIGVRCLSRRHQYWGRLYLVRAFRCRAGRPRKRRTRHAKYRQMHTTPWLLATSLPHHRGAGTRIRRIYAQRMQLDNFRTWNPPRVSGLPLRLGNSVDPTCAFPVPARRAMHASSEERMARRVSTSADCCDRGPGALSLLRAFVFATNRTRSLWGSMSLQTTHRVSIRGRGDPGAPGAVSVGPARRASAGSAPLRA